MEIIKGKYNHIKVYATVIDEPTRKQIEELANQAFTKNSRIGVMADCHAGAGCVIGTTMEIKDKVVPNLVGVDIGCGMLTVCLGHPDIDYIRLDRFIRKKIPSGTDVYSVAQPFSCDITKLNCFSKLKNIDRIYKSMGTLGGGNHFIELDKDSKDNIYLVIHTGSRNLGKQVCEYYQALAEEDLRKKKELAIKRLITRYKKNGKEARISQGIEKLNKKYSLPADLIPLEKKSLALYLEDMKIAQEFAWENRESIAKRILEHLSLSYEELKHFHTVHNYIHMEDMILRKGAISAYTDELVLIPINMRDGSVLAKGKSNEEYNYSAPHGAGRILSRNEAKALISLEEFKKSMEGIYSTSVQVDTLDESPFAYKRIEDILPNIGDTVEVIDIIKPVYNFKACHRSR